jgi:cardiolipin synthase A/B
MHRRQLQSSERVISRRLANTREHTKHRRLETWRTFPEKPRGGERGFGALERLDEVLLWGHGSLPRGPPHDGELLTYVSEGTVAYVDNLGRAGTIGAGEFQCMTAGRNTHFDGTNPSETQSAHMFQMWLKPPKVALTAMLEQRRFTAAERTGNLNVVASPDARNRSLRTQQNAVLFSGILDAGQHLVHELRPGRRAWLQVVHGELGLADVVLEAGDGVGVTAESAVSFTARSPSEVLLLDLSEPASSPVARASNGAGAVALLDGGGQAYPRMLLAIAGAQRTVHLEVYAFAFAGVGERFIAALSAAVERGVKVRVVLDGWGSARDGRRIASILRDAGCSVTIHNRLVALLIGRLGRNHRKLLLVDDAIAFLGGINIGDENLDDGERLGWADLALEIRGEQCAMVRRLVHDQGQTSVAGSLRVHLTGLGGGWRLRRRYLEAFKRATERIHVAHGYFLPDAAVVRSLVAAARRGVQVHLLLAGRSDVPLTLMATRSLYRRLLAAGVWIHEWTDSILHAKVATVDGRLLLVGSFNLDPFSLVNLESLVEVEDPIVVRQGETWIQDHLARSTLMTTDGVSTRWQIWFLGPLGRIVARVADAVSRLIARRRARAPRLHGSS